MIERYKILYEGGTAELTEKKSRFIATTKPVRTEQEAIDFISGQKKKYWDANHNCSAYVIGAQGELCRCSDDGEPGQTAGRPMLDVILGQEVRDICVVVTRYFGGTLLGTGGLVRAYSGAVREGLAKSCIVEKLLGRKISVRTDYNGIGKIQYLLAQMNISALSTDYSEQVLLTALVPVKETGRFINEITEGTSAKAQIEELDTLYYGILNKEIILFDD